MAVNSKLKHPDNQFMEKIDLHKMLEKYLKSEASRDEMALVEQWYLSFEKNAAFTDQLSGEEKEQAIEASFQSVKEALGLK